jgi:hypothetical protein
VADWGELVVGAVGGILSGAGTALVLAFIFGRKYQKIEDELEDLRNNDIALDKKCTKLDTDVAALTKENNESWQDLNRTLGQIEGSLGMLTPPPPMNPRKSRP